MSVEEWRRQIDQLDDQLLKLLNERMELALQIGRAKRAQQVAVRAPEREAQILQRLCAANGGPLDERAIRQIFSQIFQESRRLQEELL